MSESRYTTITAVGDRLLLTMGCEDAERPMKLSDSYIRWTWFSGSRIAGPTSRIKVTRKKCNQTVFIMFITDPDKYWVQATRSASVHWPCWNSILSSNVPSALFLSAKP